MRHHKKQAAAPASKKRITFYEARRRNELAKARLQELKVKERQGELVEWAVITPIAFQRDRQVRDTMLNIPSRVSGPCAAESDQHKIHALLTKEILQALEALSKEVSDEPKTPSPRSSGTVVPPRRHHPPHAARPRGSA